MVAAVWDPSQLITCEDSGEFKVKGCRSSTYLQHGCNLKTTVPSIHGSKSGLGASIAGPWTVVGGAGVDKHLCVGVW